MQNRFTKHLWQFARGDWQRKGFEDWLYSQDGLEGFLGEELYLELVSCDFSNSEEVWKLRQSVAEAIDKYRQCECPKIRDLDFIPMGFDGDDERFFANLTEILNYGEKKWWLYISKCGRCETLWMVGQDDRHYDDYFLNRISNHQLDNAQKGDWPELFFTYERMLALGRDLSTAPIYCDPASPGLKWTVEDLLKERPAITQDEISDVLGISVEHASWLMKETKSSVKSG
ncbi:MAG: hypothetical protein ABJO01_11655 [Parasphingorhabdus sp.]|uniref:hypothetical protein n=1 Tax=Parasphingorhabdus sp. TaxID=2709688 RepID=UPI003297E75D